MSLTVLSWGLPGTCPVNQIPGQPWPAVLLQQSSSLFSALPQLCSFSTEELLLPCLLCSLPAWEPRAVQECTSTSDSFPPLSFVLPHSVSISSFCSWPVSWSSHRHAANFSCGNNSGFLWWGKNKTRKSELMLESRAFPGWIYLRHTENISDVGAALIHWKGSRVGSASAPLAVHNWKKLKTHRTKDFAKMSRVSSRAWIWAPAWAGLWPGESHTALQGLHLQACCAKWFHVIAQDHQTAISVPVSGQGRAGDSSSHQGKTSALCLLSGVHHCSARSKL